MTTAANIFPRQLYAVFDDPRSAGIISWRASGGFVVHNEALLVDRVLPIFMRCPSFDNFRSQLSKYGFVRTRSPGGIAYVHKLDLFHRFRPDLLEELVARISGRQPFAQRETEAATFTRTCGCQHDCTQTSQRLDEASSTIEEQAETIAVLNRLLQEYQRHYPPPPRDFFDDIVAAIESRTAVAVEPPTKLPPLKTVIEISDSD